MSVRRKILMLHGYSQNASIFYKRMSAIRKACEKDLEFVFLDAPHVLVPADLPGHSLEWLQAAEANAAATSDESLTPRGWWSTNAERTICRGLDESLILLRDTLRGTRFHGVLGFSQGASMAAILAAVLERPESFEPFMIDGRPIHPELDFVVSISGFIPSDSLLDNILARSTPKLSTKSLHVIGDNDVIVIPERSQALLDLCEQGKARVERHDGGHFVPSKSNWRIFFKEYLINGDASSPGGTVASSTMSAPTL